MNKLFPAIVIILMVLCLVGVDISLILTQCFGKCRVLFVLSNVALVILMIIATYLVKE